MGNFMNSASTKTFEVANKLGISFEEVTFLIEKLEEEKLEQRYNG